MQAGLLSSWVAGHKDTSVMTGELHVVDKGCGPGSSRIRGLDDEPYHKDINYDELTPRYRYQ